MKTRLQFLAAMMPPLEERKNSAPQGATPQQIAAAMMPPLEERKNELVFVSGVPYGAPQ